MMKGFIILWLFLTIAVNSQKVAVIGGGISSSFFTRYLSDYDKECTVESITIFEPKPIKRPIKTTDAIDDDWQGSRVAALELKDGSIVELGASIGYKGFHLVIEMLRADPDIEMGAPFNTGRSDDNLRTGMGIYNGDGHWPLVMFRGFLKKLQLLTRYNADLVTVTKICFQSQKAFASLPKLLASNDPDTFFESPDDIWRAIGLVNAVHSSYDQLLGVMGLKRELSWWRKLLPYQGSLRNELLTAINLVNYNQDNSQVNGIVGLGSFAAATGGLFSIVGGNHNIILSALQQAIQTRKRHCGGRQTVFEVEKQVTTVVGSLDKGFMLYSGDEVLGEFDIVVLAAPLQQSRINFLVQSHMDDAVIQPMPLGGLLNAYESPTNEGHDVLPPGLAESTKRKYTQVVTTIVSNATLNADLLSLPESRLPRSICTTARGKAWLHNITAISQISSQGVYKVFSDNKLDSTILDNLFGSGHDAEYVKVWGGPHGGATPDYRGEGQSTNFLLYDGVAGETSSGALYYPSAMEQSSLASMEISAVGALAVAKLVARRLGLIQEKIDAAHDEL